MADSAAILKPWLDSDEVIELTGKRRRHAQLKELKAMGFLAAVHFRTDGSFVVLRHLVEQSKQGKTKNTPGLTLDRLRNAS